MARSIEPELLALTSASLADFARRNMRQFDLTKARAAQRAYAATQDGQHDKARRLLSNAGIIPDRPNCYVRPNSCGGGRLGYDSQVGRSWGNSVLRVFSGIAMTAPIMRGIHEPCPECGRRMCTRSTTGVRQPCSGLKAQSSNPKPCAKCGHVHYEHVKGHGCPYIVETSDVRCGCTHDQTKEKQ